MPAKKYITFDGTSGRLKQVSGTQISLGSANGGDFVTLGDDGTIDSSMMPAAGTDSTSAIVCTEALSAGDWINIYNNAGTRACRKALAADTTKQVHGFVSAAFTSGQVANVAKKGDNTKVSLSGFVAGDIGARVFLSPSTAGGTTKTCPSTAGNLVQPLGSITDINASFVVVTVDFGEQILI